MEKMENISWKDHVSNEMVLQRVGEEPQLINTIRERYAICMDVTMVEKVGYQFRRRTRCPLVPRLGEWGRKYPLLIPSSDSWVSESVLSQRGPKTVLL